MTFVQYVAFTCFYQYQGYPRKQNEHNFVCKAEFLPWTKHIERAWTFCIVHARFVAAVNVSTE